MALAVLAAAVRSNRRIEKSKPLPSVVFCRQEVIMAPCFFEVPFSCAKDV